MLDIRKLVLLREVEASGSIAAAAQALNYTRSAVSQQLSALEAETGVALVDRGSRRAGLTVAGRALVAHTERILERLEAAESVLLAVTGGVVGELRVGVPFHEGPALLVPALTRLRAEHPDLRITLHGVAASEGREAVRLGRLDVVMAARYDQVPEKPVPGLHEEPVADDRVRIAVAPDDATAAGSGPVGLGEFAHRQWILDPGSGLGRLALHSCAAAGFAPDVVADTGDMQAALGLVSLGWGVALVPDLVPARPGYPVRRIPLAEPELVRRLSLVVRRGALTRPAVAAVLNAVRVAADALVPGAAAAQPEPGTR
ncbi:LysR family transcriptional regulator [Streptomyces xantholiticus]|uniref:LysR family transcriptional regulator n=1 Tax=Streptomyces xantholiticus TaxID=68285 RepID=A0ABV1V5F3_9ACTN|nr:LysR family transcriptional regulator [Streptomyces peucetius subsp. caesius ATCC 27952]